ncbi:hypothetical protein ACHAXS_003270 [Conticribra weissflogii]
MSNPTTTSAAASSAKGPSKRRDREDLYDLPGQPQIKRGRFGNRPILPATIRRLCKRRDRDELEDLPGQPPRKRAALMKPRSPKRREIKPLENHLPKEEAPLEAKSPVSILKTSNRPRTLPLPEPHRDVHWPESLVASTHAYPKIPKSLVPELFWSVEDKDKAMEERNQEMKRKDQKEAKSTKPSTKK